MKNMNTELRTLIDKLVPCDGVGTEREKDRIKLYSEIQNYANQQTLSIVEKVVKGVGRTVTFPTRIQAEASSETLRQILKRTQTNE